MSKQHDSNQLRDIPTVVKDPDLVSKRRRQIVDAAVQLFISKGFHKTTTRELAAAAGLSIGSLYEYVKTKEDVLYLVCEAIHQEMEERITASLKDGLHGAGALQAAMEAYIRVCDQMSDHVLLIYQESKSLPDESKRFIMDHEERITGIFADLLRAGVKDLTLRPLDPSQITLMAHNISVLGHMWTFRRWSLKHSFSLEEYIEQQRGLIMGQLT